MKINQLTLINQNRQRDWIWLISLGMFGFGVLIFIRLVDLQVFKVKKYLSLSDQNRWFEQQIPAERGNITDRYGEALTLNRKRYFNPVDALAVWSPQVAIDREQALNLMAEPIATQASFLAGKNSLNRVTFSMQRSYPLGQVLAHILGYVANVTAEDLQKQSQLTLTELVGRTGLEAKLQDRLRGKPGINKFEVNALGKKQRLLSSQLAIPGPVISSTLDPYLSTIAAKAMGEKKGAVVIFDVETGEILSLISNPSFDPSLFQPITDAASHSAILDRKSQIVNYFQDPKLVMFNRAVAGTYPPGSIFKLVTALGGLSEGKITANTQVEDTGVIKVGEYGYANWYFTQYGRTEGLISLEKAIARSNDIYFYKAAEMLGPTLLADWARKFGLGKPTGLEIAGEASGTVPDPISKEKITGERWYLGNTYHFGIGQGDLLVTPVQVAQLLQTVANSGKLCQLHLLTETKMNCTDLELKPEDASLVLSGMIKACSPGGTAFPFFLNNQTAMSKANLNDQANFQEKLLAGAVACKTGTAEIGAANSKGQRPTHGWFVMTARIDQILKSKQSGIFSASSTSSTSSASSAAILDQTDWQNNQKWLNLIHQKGFPRQIGIVVLVESSSEKIFVEGSSDAAPVAKQIYDWILN
jgi:penicillin-binding protein 2